MWGKSKKSSKSTSPPTANFQPSSTEPVILKSSSLDDKVENDTAQEERRIKAVKEFRELLGEGNEQYDDHTLLRFAVARNFQLDKAKDKLEATVKWRREQDIDSIPLPVLNPGTPILCPIRGLEPLIPDSNIDVADEKVPDSLLRIYKYFGGNAVHKTDKQGRHVYIERLGYHDAKHLAKYVKTEELVNWHIRCQELSHRVIMPEMSRRAGRVIDKETVIFDCEGMGFHQLNMSAMHMYRAIADLDQKHYPERLGQLFVINTPFMFVSIWSIAKSWLDPGMLKKIYICGKDYKKVLLEHISEENLPSFLGGTCTCDHMPGGCVPSVILKNIPPLKRPTVPSPAPSRPSSPIPEASRNEGFRNRIRITKGDQRSIEVFATVIDEDILGQATESKKGYVNLKFRITDGEGAVKLGCKFKAANREMEKDEIILPPTEVSSKTNETQEYTFKAKENGEFILTWYFDQWSKLDSVAIEYLVNVDGEPYGDD